MSSADADAGASSWTRASAIPADAHRPDPRALAAGLGLVTDREHVVVLPELRVKVVGPPERTLRLTLDAGADYAARMPDGDGFTVRAEGLGPDALDAATVRWTARLDYQTIEATPRASAVEFTATARGARAPADLFRRAPGRILAGGSTAHHDTTTAAGGRLSVTADVTLPDGRRGQDRLPAGTHEVLAATGRAANPPLEAVVRALNAAMPGRGADAQWLAQILCVETGIAHFNAAETRVPYNRVGHPVMNRLGDGGAGIAQVTDPHPGPAELWDWRINVAAGVAIYDEKARHVRAYVTAVTAAAAGHPDRSPHPELTNVNAARRTAGLPPLDAVTVPALSAQQFREDQARGYNGYPRPRNPRNRSQFGLAWHEYRLATEDNPLRLATTRERTEGDRRVADAVWERIPADERPRWETTTRDHQAGQPIGMAEYVLRVIANGCSAEARAQRAARVRVRRGAGDDE